MPHILHEFFALTKGYEYIIILLFLLVAISFWRFLTYREKE
jgi:hypothetical protein